MPSFTPRLQLETLFVLDGERRIRFTREPRPTRGPAFALIRDHRAVAWAVNADVPSESARELVARARTEAPATVLTDAPRHAGAYAALLGGTVE